MKIAVPALAAFAILAIGLPSTPALATTARQAMNACDLQPGCTYRTGDDGWVDMHYNGHLIQCPPNDGQCILVYHHAQIDNTVPFSGANGFSTNAHGDGGTAGGGTALHTPPVVTGLSNSTFGNGGTIQ